MLDLDLDRAIGERALAAKLVPPDELARCQQVVAKKRAAGQRAHLAQVLVQEKLISPRDLLRLQDEIDAPIYECPRCHRRHPGSAIKAGVITCQGCGKAVRLHEPDHNFSRVEVLASRDPRELSVSLRLEGSSKSRAISEVDLDRYDVEEELGRGGYGVVFKARHKDLDRPVALKVIRATQDLDAVMLERFVREGRAASRLQHPNICQVYDIGRCKDVLALSMELVSGKALRDMIREGPLPWRQACEILLGILAGVQHAHENKVIHRDLKPSNIIIEEGTGRPRLIDFGLAKDASSGVDLTGAGQILGTPFYLAPEQVEGRSNEVDARSDVFALGVILFECLTGKRPFVAKTRNEVYGKILHDEPPPPSKLVPGIPEAVDQVVAKALEKAPAKRFESAKAFSEAIVAALEAPPEKEKRAPTKRKSRGEMRALPPARPQPAPVGAIAAVAVIALVLAGVAFVATSSSPPAPVAPPEPPPVAPPVVPVATPPPPPPVVETPVKVEPKVVDPEVAPAATSEPAVVETPPVEVAPVESAAPVAAAPPPSDPKLELDDGSGDEREHPFLLEKNEKDWIARAFAVNALADGPKTPRSLRGLRLALLDRHPLVRAFALRGLNARAVGDLEAWGSKALFFALLANLKATKEEPYLRKTSRSILKALVGKDLGDDGDPWRAWWKEAGEARFAAAFAARGTDTSLVNDAASGTREREVGRWVTQARDSGLDVVLCIDVTPSMKKTIDTVRSQVTEITSFFTLLLGGKGRLGYVTFGDTVVQACALTEKFPQFVREVEKIEIWNDPADKTIEEGPDEALFLCFDEKKNPLKFRKGTRKVCIVISDAPLHAHKEKDALDAIAKMAKRGFIVSTVACEPPAKYAHKRPHEQFAKLAEAGGGTFVPLENPEELIARLLGLSLGSKHEEDLRRFVRAYREVTGVANR